MNLVVTRDEPTLEETEGTLSIDEVFFGYTLELPELGEGETKQQGIISGIIKCIPKGNYFVEVTWSEHMQKRLPLIYNDKKSLAIITPQGVWAGVRFHGGNTYLDSLACILTARARYMNTPSSFFDKAHHMIRNFIQGSLSDSLTKKLDNGEIHTLTIK